jgi:hypothetical protein
VGQFEHLASIIHCVPRMGRGMSARSWPILDLANLAGGHRNRGVVGVFVCYLDDSDAELSSIVTLAGYVARLELWQLFEQKAGPIFNRYNVSVLHAKELHDTDGCFRGWSMLKKRSFIHDVYALANRCVAFGISVSARKNRIKQWRRERPKNSGMSAYGVCFSSIMHTVIMNNSLRKEIQSDGISFIVESGHRNNAEIEKSFHRQSKLEFYTGIARSISFADKQSSRAIQIADFFAFYSRRAEATSDRFDGKLSLPGNQLYMIAREQVQHFHRVLRGDIHKDSMAEAINPWLVRSSDKL